MAPRKGRAALYDSYRAASGWYLAAWRDYRGLTLDELAAEIGSSKGYVSDLETGAARPDRPIRRFNRDIVDSVAKAIGTTGGRLIDVNPYQIDHDADQFDAALRSLDDTGRQAVLQLAATLSGKTGTSG
jgi:predicted transcriptional regulator